MIDLKTIFGNDYSPFCEVDPFNQHNEVSGFISRKPNEYYGSLDTADQYNQVVKGQEPYILFDSLRDTPFNDQIKILRVKVHSVTVIDMFTNNNDMDARNRFVGAWLGAIGIRNYPELVGDR